MIKARVKQYSGKAILIRCDNVRVCAIITKKSACLERKDLQQLIRLICKRALKHKFYFWIKWIATEDNVRADGLSREKPTALQTCPCKTQPMNETMTIAHETIEVYREARNRMQRHRKITKKCARHDVECCNFPPLYNKWKK